MVSFESSIGRTSGIMQQRHPSEPRDLSPASTTVAFDTIIPPLRVPVPSRPEDDPSKGRWVLAFKDEYSWRQAWVNSEDKIADQCQMGARVGCSISATNACRIPWWKSVLVFLKAACIEDGEREQCEENEMTGCMTAAEESCSKYAREICEPVFANMRIADPEQSLDPRFIQSFRRKRWTKEVKVPPAPQNNVEDPESITDVKIISDHRERVMTDEESTRRQWGGPTWSEGVAESESSSIRNSSVEGWEGGLIRPNIDRSSIDRDSFRSK